MHLLFPQDLHDFVWLEAGDFRPALFTGQGQESSQIAANRGEHIDAKVGSGNTRADKLFASRATLAKTRAQRKLALPRCATTAPP